MKFFVRTGIRSISERRPFKIGRITYRYSHSNFQFCEDVYAPSPLHIATGILRQWKWAVFYPMYRMRIWYLEPTQLFVDGRFVWPWSKCWRKP